MDLRSMTEACYKSLSKYEIEHSEKQVETSLSKWINLFFKHMGYSSVEQGLLLHKPRFSEIRPIHFQF